MLAAVIHGHLHHATVFSTGNHVVVGQYITIWGDDRTGAFSPTSTSHRLDRNHRRQNLGGYFFHRTLFRFLTGAIVCRLSLEGFIDHGGIVIASPRTHANHSAGNRACGDGSDGRQCGGGAQADFLLLLRLRRQRGDHRPFLPLTTKALGLWGIRIGPQRT